MLSIFKMANCFLDLSQAIIGMMIKEKKFYNIKHDDDNKADVLETLNYYKWYKCTRKKNTMTKRNRNHHQKESHWKVRCQKKSSLSTREKKEESNVNKYYIKKLPINRILLLRTFNNVCFKDRIHVVKFLERKQKKNCCYCRFLYLKTKSENWPEPVIRCSIYQCSLCNVYLYLDHFHIFHTM